MKTDCQLQSDIMAELKWERSIHAPQIGVEVRDGVVTLSGEVETYAEKFSAERAAQRVAGVRALTVALSVNPTDNHRRSDTDIARSAENVLLWTSLIPPDSVKVMVEAGRITLTGEVNWQYQRQAAANAIHNLLGVTGIDNRITLKQKVSGNAVKEEIEAALRRSTYGTGNGIQIHVKDAEVTFSGTVHSWSERDMATHSAWNTPGVHSVIDRMVMGV